MTEIRTTSSTGGQKGVKLARHSLIPPGPLNALAEHYGVGGLKYESHQWRRGYEVSKSYDAIQRHNLEWLAGRTHDTCSNSNFEGCSDVDSDGNPFKSPREDACYNHTASHHMSAVAWHAFAIQQFEEDFPEHDDRYRPEEADVDSLAAEIFSGEFEATLETPLSQKWVADYEIQVFDKKAITDGIQRSFDRRGQHFPASRLKI